MLDRLGAVALGQMHTAQKQMRLRIHGILQEDTLRAHGGAGGFSVHEEHFRDAQLGISVIGVQLQDTLKTLPRIFQMQLIERGVPKQKEERHIVRRLLKGIADSLEG
ncbi:hypothetical protein BGE01nite_12920 [Brevifollis gellanilyticus]|uniref:Uncharacterized protein n=1 Tax=Brevifollis gellanilyticus TaxID=748831 RepID=A0A512M6N0_9BACT|nr:hypothetical protein BGE01nite_12920 [Brevifollis gellanilyticus]